MTLRPEPFCTVLFNQLNEDITASIEQFPRPTRRLDSLLKQKLVQTRWFAGPLPDIRHLESATRVASQVCATLSRRASLPRLHQEEESMHPKDLMKPDLFSAIVLLGSAGLIFVSLLLIVAASLTRA